MTFLRSFVYFLLTILINTAHGRVVSILSRASGVPDSCREHLNWAFNIGKYTHPEWYASMEETCGVSVEDASYEDLQRYFKCKNINPEDCNDRGLSFPSTCTMPLCDVCSVSKCCAYDDEDVYNPYVCKGRPHPVNCCPGLQKTFVPGRNNYVCKAHSSAGSIPI